MKIRNVSFYKCYSLQRTNITKFVHFKVNIVDCYPLTKIANGHCNLPHACGHVWVNTRTLIISLKGMDAAGIDAPTKTAYIAT